MMCKKILLNEITYAIVDDEDYDLVSRFNWHLIDHGKYAQCTMYMGTVQGKTLQAYMSLHRFIMRPPVGMEIDHINHNGLDNRRDNLRICTKTQNAYNQIITCGKASKYKGVSRSSSQCRPWRARIKVALHRIHIGHFVTEEAAAMGYNEAAIKYYGKFACLNNVVGREY